MTAAGWLLLMASAAPLAEAMWANRLTSLFHATGWAWLAWTAWAWAARSESKEWSYLSLALTACVGVAVLGARRPGVTAWNFIVIGLLVVLLLPWGEAAALGTPLLPGTFRMIFLATLLGVGVVNYLPTRLGAGAVLMGIGCTLELRWLVSQGDAVLAIAGVSLAIWCIGLAPAAAWFGLVVCRQDATTVDRRWCSFRDRFGLIWAQRLREQFNRAAANAGLDVELSWTGMRPTDDARPLVRETLAALMKRFGMD